jgi:hypothetical protein
MQWNDARPHVSKKVRRRKRRNKPGYDHMTASVMRQLTDTERHDAVSEMQLQRILRYG